MNYILLAIMAMVFQSFYYVLVKNAVSTTSPPILIIIVNTTASTVALLYLAMSDEYSFTLPASNMEWFAAIAAGLAVSGGLLSFYRALSEGPISAVQPIFGLATVIAAVGGALVFQESLTVQKIAGIVLAAVAIYLVSA